MTHGSWDWKLDRAEHHLNEAKAMTADYRRYRKHSVSKRWEPQHHETP